MFLSFLIKLISTEAAKKVAVYAAEKLVKSTKTTFDDEGLKIMHMLMDDEQPTPKISKPRAKTRRASKKK